MTSCRRLSVLWLVLAAALVSGASSLAGNAGDERARVEQLILEAERAADVGDLARAVTRLDEARALSEALGDCGLLAQCLDLMGDIASEQGEHALRAERHQKALDLAMECGDRRVEAKILSHIGHGLWRQARYDEAVEFHRRALDIAIEIGDRTGEAAILRFLGLVHFKEGAYCRAIEYLEAALKTWESIGDLHGQSVALRDIGTVHRDRRECSQALDFYRSALRIREKLGDLAGQGAMLIEIGVTYSLNGALMEASAHFRRALQLADRRGDSSARASALYHLGLAEARQGEPEDALEVLQEALTLRQEEGNLRAEAWILAAIASALTAQGNDAFALDAHRKAQKIWEAIGDRRALASDLDTTGTVCVRIGDDRGALGYFQRALALAREIDLPYLPLSLSNLGMVSARLGDRERAIGYGQEAVAEAERIGNPEMLWVTEHRIGTIRRELGQREEALICFQRSLAAIERLRSDVIPEDETKMSFVADKEAVYADTINLLMELGRTEHALELAESARARALLDLLAGRSLPEPSAETAAGHEGDGVSNIRSRDGPPAEPSSSSRMSRSRAGSLPPSHPVAEDLENDSIPSPARLDPLPIELLRTEVTGRRISVIEYFVTERRLFIWVMDPEGRIHAAASAVARTELDRLVRVMRGAMRAGSAPGVNAGGRDEVGLSPVLEDPRPILRQLHRVLIEPVETWLPRRPDDPVTIVPHSSLFLVSFAALLDRNGRYFIENHTISYSPAISVLPYMARSRERAPQRDVPRVLLIGNPLMPRVGWSDTPLAALPGAEAETKGIGRIYPTGRVTRLVGVSADEDSVKMLAPTSTVIHFATHGIIRDDLPLESFLALSPVAPSDGRLTAREIFQLDLRADLVVLSACNTGLGTINGDGVVGLSRAFACAGARSVVVSLWPVADVTAQQEMETFYSALNSPGLSKAVAMRQAQISLLSKLRRHDLRAPSGRPLGEHPILWAPFILIGESR